MKNNLRTMLMCAAFGTIFGGVTMNSFAQIKTGGYKKVAVTDAGVVAAAEFAAQNQGEKDGAEISVQSIETAQRQTVAGANYKLCVEVLLIAEGDDAEVRQLVQTVVFLNLKKQYTLKSWEEVESCQTPK